ncbi:MAG: hypothetical protein GX614_10200 [Sandaracinaceae bacterium]|nr:hypothetical protein [Sandaracinaceae bacterium]
MALLALPLSLAVGCGDDDPNGEDPPDPTDPGNGVPNPGTKVDLEKHCSGGAEAWNLSRLVISGEGVTYGFNLDKHVTGDNEAKTPATGCGIADGNPEGIDNSLAGLLDMVALLGSDEEEEVDINAIIQEAIDSGSIEVIAYIRGYDPDGDNDEVELTLVINGYEYDELVNVKGTVEGGKIVATLERLPLTLSGIELDLGEEPVELNLTINIFDVKVEIDEPGNETSAEAMLGGGVQVAGEGGLQADLESLINDLGFGEMIDELGGLDTLLELFLDHSSDGASCDSLTVGASVTFTYNNELCN